MFFEKNFLIGIFSTENMIFLIYSKMSTIEKFFNNAFSLKAKDHMFFIPEMKGQRVNLYYNAVAEEVFMLVKNL